MRSVIGVVALLAALGACKQTSAPGLQVKDAVVQLPVLPERPGAAYFTLENGEEGSRLVAVTSPRIQRIELHDNRMEGGVMRMGPLQPDAAIFEDGRLSFTPGGKHAMLFGIDPTLRPGERVLLTFTFDPARTVTTQAEVRAFGPHASH